MELRERVLDIMKKEGKPLKTTEIATLAGLEKKDAEKAIKLLKEEDKIFSPIRCFWQSR